MVGLLAISPSEMEAVRNFPFWSDPKFVFTFVAAATMGSILNYSTFLCTVNNSALTTTVIGCLKVHPHARADGIHHTPYASTNFDDKKVIPATHACPTIHPTFNRTS